MLGLFFLDICEVNNGGCDKNAVCTRSSTNNAPKCTCKPGYTNVGCTSNVVCKGMLFVYTFDHSQYSCAILDSCLVNNGGCEKNAICSHDPKSNEVKCICKRGFTNTGTESVTNCTGMILVFD